MTRSELAAVWSANPNISADLRHLLEEVLQAEDEVDCEEYELARARIDAILESYPYDSPNWNFNSAGEFFGNPPGYAQLRVLDAATQVGLNNPPENPDVIRLTLIAVQATSYEKPDGSGRVVVPIVPEMRANDYENPREAANMFRHFIYAMTEGRVRMEFQVGEIDELQFNYYPELDGDGSLPGRVQMQPFGSDGGDLSIPVDMLEPGIRNSSDMMWLLYPPPTKRSGFRRRAGLHLRWNRSSLGRSSIHPSLSLLERSSAAERKREASDLSRQLVHA